MSLQFIARDNYHLVVRPDRPDWAAVNGPGAEALRRLAAGESEADIAAELIGASGLDEGGALTLVRNFARETRRIWDTSGANGYRGRAEYLKPRELRELWLHVNNRCNFACRHCLVSCGPTGSDGLPTAALERIIDEAAELGVETFFITGGEPLLREDLPDVLARMLTRVGTHVVVLTNGSLLDEAFLARIDGLDRARLHLQVSLDGSSAELNDRLRSRGSFEMATAGIRRATERGLEVTVATVVVEENLDDLPTLTRRLPELGVRAQHLMWQHVRERGAKERRAAVDDLTRRVLALKQVADEVGVVLDNYESHRAIAHGEPGVKRDLTNACWDSLAVYVDGHAYPSAALVGIEELRGGNVVEQGLRAAWLESPAFREYRARTVAGRNGDDPLAFLHGGGDPEHAFFFGRMDGGHEEDPYLPLYRALVHEAIDETVAGRMALIGAREDLPMAYQLMGQDGLGCPAVTGAENGGEHEIDFTHSNCVLIQDVVGYSRRLVQDYYGEAAVQPKSEICCPVQGSARDLEHIPPSLLERTYGCGSPVFAAGIREGETVVDLGSGVGVECFVASKLVGPQGKVIGVDMTRDMLAVAREAAGQVAGNLGYANAEFREGYLEALPIADGSVDVVISNCVINLSPEKLKVFSEVRRVLRPGGRMVISDIVSREEIPQRVKYNPRLKSECIGGALTETDLLLLLSKLGFGKVSIEYRVPWREVDGVQFYSDTVWAERGEQATPYLVELEPKAEAGKRHTEGCVVCGRPLVYAEGPREARCHYCGRELRTWATCEAGHFVCDQCHGGDYLQFVRSFVAQCELTDPVEAFLTMRAAFPFPMHGPEHHVLVPAALLIAYRNSGGEISPKAIENALSEAAKLPGGTCAYWGGCAAALGVGVDYSAILKASPVKSHGRQVAQTVVTRALQRIAEFRAARCCRRESLIALQVGAANSGEFLPTSVASTYEPTCDQSDWNRECIRDLCPFKSRGQAPTMGSR
jgi:MoaA/NifB/PqqE/SkfB family radical SAM enzyme/SAM-dependent methyltransferase